MKSVLLMGGLGNQMFQYAFARSYSLKNNVDVCLDLSFLEDKTPKENFTYRDFELDVFNIKLDARRDLQRQRNFLIEKVLKLIGGDRRLIEKNFHYQSSFLLKKSWQQAVGYFQSEKYFMDIREQLLSDFSLSRELSVESKNVLEKIKNRNSISVHVRRGDFLATIANQKFHGSASLKYYSDAIQYICSRIYNPVILFFSDDLDWVKANLAPDCESYFIDHNIGKKSYEDMYLMSKCSHNITANSSFSWWGAWLNTNNQKIVISPSKWFNDSSVDTRDVIPDSWIKL